MDGVDVALVDTDGERVAGLGPTHYRPYSDGERDLLRQAVAEATTLTDRAARPGVLAAAETMVTDAHAEAVENFFAEEGIQKSDVAVIGFHGQTVLHRPERKLTVQIGDGAALAKRIGVTVAYDFRAADVAAGGQGAPLVPVFHRALVEMLGGERPVAVLNVGGVANLTYCDGDAPPVACDTGPGNALIDDFMRAHAGQPFDSDGAAAAAGKIDEAFLARALRDPFFDRPPPKSLDRNDFAALDRNLPNWSVEDGAATLAAFTAATVALAMDHLPRPPRRWIVSGGGARNRALMAMLEKRLAPARVETADSVGWSRDALEAQAFGYLAARTLNALPITFPTTTGAPRPMTGGRVARP